MAALLVSLLAAAMLTGVVTPAAAARRVHHKKVHHKPVLKMIWGPVDLPNGQSAFPIYHELGVNVFEIELWWSRVTATEPADPTNPNDPAYHWPSELDQVMQQAAQYGIKVCLLVQRTPPWANSGQPDYYAPNNPGDFGNFLTAAARRYPSVRYWMIWGEPTLPSNFQPMPWNSPAGPERYALLLNSAYYALKGVSRQNIVIGGDVFTSGDVTPEDFIKWMRLPNGKPPPLDYFGNDPYTYRFPIRRQSPYPGHPGWRDIDDLGPMERQLTRTYHRQIPLWLAEYGISTPGPDKAFNFSTSLDGQAKYLRAAYKVVNLVNYVAGLGWFELLDEPPPDNLTLGLMTANLQPKPAFYAYQRAR